MTGNPPPHGMRPQPRGARGTVGHPYSALNLRLILATFGFVVFAVLTWLSARADLLALAVICGVVVLTALADIVVVQLRRRARHRAEPGVHHSMFE
jgi:positive regulator of sigma E activity